jgi:hypothetical protein
MRRLSLRRPVPRQWPAVVDGASPCSSNYGKVSVRTTVPDLLACLHEATILMRKLLPATLAVFMIAGSAVLADETEAGVAGLEDLRLSG